MTKLIRYLSTGAVALAMMTVGSQAASLMSLAEPAIEPSPLKAVEDNGEGKITFLITERNNVGVLGSNRFRANVTMGKLDLKGADTSLVSVQDARNSNADVTDKFDIRYLGAPDYMVVVQQKATEALPGDMRYLVTIPVVVTRNTPAANPNNGFLINMSSEGDALANGASSDYTFTQASSKNEVGLPDYSVALALDTTTFINNPRNFFTTIRVRELSGGLNSGDVVYSINKNKNMELHFDRTLTVSPSGRILNNKDWELIDTGASYKFKYTGHGAKFPSKSQVFFGLSGTFTPPVGAKGKFIFKSKLRNGSGDTNIKNNEDSDAISYSNIN